MPDETYTQGRLHVESSRSPIDGAISAGLWAGGEPMAGAIEIATFNRHARPLANARRLAAAWNACEGLDTATIERLDVKALLEALRAITTGGIDSRRPLTTEGYENIINGLREVARAILARAEGKQP